MISHHAAANIEPTASEGGERQDRVRPLPAGQPVLDRLRQVELVDGLLDLAQAILDGLRQLDLREVDVRHLDASASSACVADGALDVVAVHVAESFRELDVREVDLRQGDVGHGGLLPVECCAERCGRVVTGRPCASARGVAGRIAAAADRDAAARLRWVDGHPTERRDPPLPPARGTPTATLEVLLGHPGGPFFTRRDEGHWTIPKGEPDDPADDLLAVARREFAEETGHPAPPPSRRRPPIELGTIVQKGGKVVHAWAIEGDLDPATAASNEFEMEWPPRSGSASRSPRSTGSRGSGRTRRAAG